MNEKSVWTEHLTARAARKVASALKAAGYRTASRENCRGYVINVAQYFEPGDVEARQKLLRLICETAGIQPRAVPPMTDTEIDEELRQLADDEPMDDWPETEQEKNHL